MSGQDRQVTLIGGGSDGRKVLVDATKHSHVAAYPVLAHEGMPAAIQHERYVRRHYTITENDGTEVGFHAWVLEHMTDEEATRLPSFHMFATGEVLRARDERAGAAALPEDRLSLRELMERSERPWRRLGRSPLASLAGSMTSTGKAAREAAEAMTEIDNAIRESAERSISDLIVAATVAATRQLQKDIHLAETSALSKVQEPCNENIRKGRNR